MSDKFSKGLSGAVLFALTAILVGCSSDSPTSTRTDPEPQVIVTGVWNGWNRYTDLDVSDLGCDEFHDDVDFGNTSARFDLQDDGFGNVTGRVDTGDEGGGELRGTFDGTTMVLSNTTGNSEFCLELACPAGPDHVLCLTDVTFDGTVMRKNSWQGERRDLFEDEDGSLLFSGPFRADR